MVLENLAKLVFWTISSVKNWFFLKITQILAKAETLHSVYCISLTLAWDLRLNKKSNLELQWPWNLIQKLTH